MPVAAALLSTTAARQAARRRRGRLRLAARAARRQARATADATARDGPREPHADRLGRATSRRAAAQRRDAGVTVARATTTSPSCASYIDWQPFFNAWEMKGRFPDILNNPASGEAARKLYDDAQAMLDRVDRGEVADAPTAWSGCSRPTRSATTSRSTPTTPRDRGARRRCTTCASRASTATACPTGRSADFVAPKETGLADHVGALRGDRRARQPGEGRGVQGRARRLLRDPARVARRPARRGVRRAAARAGAHASSGATRPTSTSTTRSCSRSSTTASGPAPGYPACPDHTEKPTLGSCSTSRRNTGIELTESMAMWPGASVSGWYFSPPAVAVLRGRPARPRPGRGLRRAQGLDAGRGGAVALAEPRLRAGGLSPRIRRFRDRRQSAFVPCGRECYPVAWRGQRSSEGQEGDTCSPRTTHGS